jgi:Flp pilus assembly pilin Flp
LFHTIWKVRARKRTDLAGDDLGAATLEYALLLGLVAMVLVGSLLIVGSRTASSYRNSTTTINNVVN